MSEPKTEGCSNCGAVLTDSYCAACGEARPSNRAYSLLALLKDGLHDVLHLEGKALRTVRCLLLWPGFLTTEFFEGRRKKYTKPVSLFILTNLVFFLIQPHTGYMRWNFDEYYGGGLLDYRPLIRARLASTSEPQDRFRARFDTMVKVQKKSLMLFVVPLVALIMCAAYWRRYYVEHLVFSIHFFAFFLLYWGVGLTLFFRAVRLLHSGAPGILTRSLSGEAGLLFFSGIGVAPYLFWALRRVYRQSVLTSALKALGLTAVVFASLMAYREIVFLATFYSL